MLLCSFHNVQGVMKTLQAWWIDQLLPKALNLGAALCVTQVQRVCGLSTMLSCLRQACITGGKWHSKLVPRWEPRLCGVRQQISKAQIKLM